MATKPKIKGIIFDLDGTLIDTIADIATAMNQALAELGYPEHPAEDYKGFVGNGFSGLAKNVLPANNQKNKDVDKLIQKFSEIYETTWYLHSKPFPGIMYLIQICIARKIKLAILSNKPHYFTKKMNRHFFRGVMIKHFKNPFGVYSGEQTDKPQKPDPTIALELAERLMLKPANIALVGDSPVDVQTAKNAGMMSFAATWGYNEKAKLKDAKPDHLFDTVQDLIKYIESQPSI